MIIMNRIDRASALSFLGIRGEPGRETKALFDKYEPLLLEKISPRYVYKAFPFGAESACYAILQGGDIKEHINGCDEAVLLAVTLGTQVDGLIRSAEASEMAGAVVLDAMASAAAEQVCDYAEAEIRSGYQKITTRYSPGYGDFPLSVQNGLLQALEAGRKIGLYANESGLLIPGKSVTAVIGAVRGAMRGAMRGANPISFNKGAEN